MIFICSCFYIDTKRNHACRRGFFYYLFPEAEVLLDGVWSFAASAPLVAGSLEEAGGADEDGVELSSDEEEGTVVEDAGSLVSAVVLSFEDSAVDSL